MPGVPTGSKELHIRLLSQPAAIPSPFSPTGLTGLTLLGTATFPHGISYYQPHVQMASLDHAIWFHRPFRADDWLLYDMKAPVTSSARGLNHGQGGIGSCGSAGRLPFFGFAIGGTHLLLQ